MKEYEARETQRTLLPMLPVAVRIDGRAFHTFTRGCDKPFDAALSESFHYTTQVLVKESGAVIGYTQSDEISLIPHQEDPKSELFFDGKIYKLTSVLASIATAAFNQMWLTQVAKRKGAEGLWGIKPATFDCRVWQLPTKWEAVNMLLWREKDAHRNSVASAAQSVYSDKELHGKGRADMHEMLFKKGINWADYPKWAKTGAFFRRRQIERTPTPEELARIPEKYRPVANAKVIRTDIVEWPYELGKLANKVEAVFDDAPPVFLKDLDTAAPAVAQ
jgi:tRNA(His) 5'-end guanylyltransferase